MLHDEENNMVASFCTNSNPKTQVTESPIVDCFFKFEQWLEHSFYTASGRLETFSRFTKFLREAGKEEG